ncbi:class I SAM-dependent methyltransferase [Paeniglutamicibacter sp. MACA_103]|uniref:class I SAM-dependent methyltransferase n=1 Tax=Paeniglutamicibacter sp. MACA_103 TaxID=3377337 RepID=UPI0038957BC5
MSDIDQSISRYTTGNLRERLHAALRAAGLDPEVLRPADLGEADQFHTGGREATVEVARAVGIGLGTRVLDVGSGIGGPARHFAGLGAVVTGVDVTQEFVDLARELNLACLMAGSITMVLAPGQDTSLPPASFDAATMLHVGMNLADKPAVFREVYRLLRPGGVFGVYDLMGTNELDYPVPWADAASSSYVESAEAYANHLRAAGFNLTGNIDRTTAVLKYMGEAAARRESPALLAAQVLLGTDLEERMGHVAAAVKSGALAPRLLVALRPA